MAHREPSSRVPAESVLGTVGRGQAGSVALVESVQERGRLEGERGEVKGGPAAWPGSGRVGRCSGTRRRAQRREKEEGTDCISCHARRGGIGGHVPGAQGRREHRAEGGYSALVHCSTLQSAAIACHGMQMASCAWPSLSTSSWEFLICSIKLNS